MLFGQSAQLPFQKATAIKFNLAMLQFHRKPVQGSHGGCAEICAFLLASPREFRRISNFLIAEILRRLEELLTVIKMIRNYRVCCSETKTFCDI